MASCANHPTVEATKECAGCKRQFCNDCVVDLGGWTYCGYCKNAAVAAAQQVQEFKLPKEALTYAIVGIFCCGIILEPIALVKAFDALGQIKRDPRLPGRGSALAAIWIGFIALGLNVVGVILKLSGAFAQIR